MVRCLKIILSEETGQTKRDLKLFQQDYRKKDNQFRTGKSYLTGVMRTY